MLIEKTFVEDQIIAKKSLLELNSKSIEKGNIKNITINNTTIEVPKKSIDLFIQILTTIADGKDFVLIPSESEISTQQAADLLKVSRPFIVKLLLQDKIPYTKAGTHRRIKLKDLVAFQSQLKETRSKNIEFLINQSQELNMGY